MISSFRQCVQTCIFSGGLEEMPGQITLDTEFGKELRALASNPRYTVFVEVGTWNGEGSTLCLAEGMMDRKDANLISLETNYTQWALAKKFWADRQHAFKLHLLHGRLGDRIMTDKEVLEHPLFERIKEHYALHYTQDVADFKASRRVHLRACDVVLLDGGEFSSYSDWKAVEGLSPRIVALDDVNVLKNAEVLKELLEAGWKLIWKTEERNGAAILERPERPQEPQESPAPPSSHTPAEQEEGQSRSAQ